jgi:two-component system nitrogen regulation response regulator GlnG
MLADGEARVHARVLAVVERELIVRALRVMRGHQSQASELLGVSRVTLRNKMRELGITLDTIVSGAGEESD